MMARKTLLVCGILSSLLYVAMKTYRCHSRNGLL